MILEFQNVTGISKKFSLQNISFSLPSGYIMGLAGKNGAGKSTLFDYMMNPKTLYTGKILINGEDIREDFDEMKNKIGFVSDEQKFFREYTARENVEILGLFYKEWDMEIFKSTMEKMEVSTQKIVGKMSRGEYFKFQMAFALAHKSKLYLLDEVTAGMDPVFRIDFFKLLQKIIETEEASIIMTSHIRDEMIQKTDYVGILEDGKMITFGESLEVLDCERKQREFSFTTLRK